MKHSPKQITMDLAEWQEVEKELQLLRAPATGEELTEAEHQEATGILLIRALQNPALFRTVGAEPIDLGKYRAIFAVAPAMNTGTMTPDIKVKFVRT